MIIVVYNLKEIKALNAVMWLIFVDSIRWIILNIDPNKCTHFPVWILPPKFLAVKVKSSLVNY